MTLPIYRRSVDVAPSKETDMPGRLDIGMHNTLEHADKEHQLVYKFSYDADPTWFRNLFETRGSINMAITLTLWSDSFSAVHGRQEMMRELVNVRKIDLGQAAVVLVRQLVISQINDTGIMVQLYIRSLFAIAEQMAKGYIEIVVGQVAYDTNFKIFWRADLNFFSSSHRVDVTAGWREEGLSGPSPAAGDAEVTTRNTEDWEPSSANSSWVMCPSFSHIGDDSEREQDD